MSVLEIIKKRRSVRRYLSKKISDDLTQRLLESLRLAPSACNYQPWRFILVSEEQHRRQVAEACKNQLWMADAPLIIVACGNPDQAYKFMGGYGNSVDIDVAIAMDHLTLVATEEGLGTCWIGAFDEEALKTLLNVPAHSKIITLTPVGYPADKKALLDTKQKNRKEGSEIFFVESWDLQKE